MTCESPIKKPDIHNWQNENEFSASTFEKAKNGFSSRKEGRIHSPIPLLNVC